MPEIAHRTVADDSKEPVQVDVDRNHDIVSAHYVNILGPSLHSIVVKIYSLAILGRKRSKEEAVEEVHAFPVFRFHVLLNVSECKADAVVVEELAIVKVLHIFPVNSHAPYTLLRVHHRLLPASPDVGRGPSWRRRRETQDWFGYAGRLPSGWTVAVEVR